MAKIDPYILGVVIDRVLTIFNNITICVSQVRDIWFEATNRRGIYAQQLLELLSHLNCRLLIISKETEDEKLTALWTALDKFCAFFRKYPFFMLKARPKEELEKRDKIHALNNNFIVYKLLVFKVFKTLSIEYDY